MRIISGKFKGKKLIGYDIDGTRPTQDRVKESVFAMIQNDLNEATVLDLFTGSGNLGIEALSNGANISYFVDSNHKCIEALKKNLESVSNAQYQIIKKDYYEALMDFVNDAVQFDVVFLDPPYQLQCMDKILDIIISKKLLKSNGIIICEYEHNQFGEKYEGLILEKEKSYGYKNVRIYRKE